MARRPGKRASSGGMYGPIQSLILVGVLGSATFCCAGTFTYEIDVQILYDVVADSILYPDTAVWGMPEGTGMPSGTLDLVIDAAGNVSGSSPVDSVYGLGMLYGMRLYALYNALFLLNDGSWGTPEGNVAPLTGGTVDLRDTFIGDFYAMNSITGFIKDGNSGDFFHMTNGLGLDGRLEFTVTSPEGMSMTFQAKCYGGAGIGWYLFGVDGGDMSYNMGTDAASVGITGVVAYDVWMDPTTQTFSIEQHTLLEDFPAAWSQWGRRIDSYSGAIDQAGNFVGTAHFAGIEFTSLTASTTNGAFEDGNSPGFNAADGLVVGDTFSTVMSDVTGRFTLVFGGTLLSQSLPTGVAEGESGVVSALRFGPVFPNPSPGAVRIPISLEQGGRIRVDLFDVGGRFVRLIHNSHLPAGQGTISWNGHLPSGERAAAGIYFARLRTGDRTRTTKVVLRR